jgi:hypothetical protein
MVTRLLHPPVQHEEEEEEMTTHRAGPKGEVGRGGSGSRAGVAANRFSGLAGDADKSHTYRQRPPLRASCLCWMR